MQQLSLSTSNVETMGTREIAGLLSLEHRNVKRSAERLSEKGILTAPMERLNFNHRGNDYFEYLLSKRDSIILVAQNCPEFTARIVDRWQELEDQVATPQLETPKLDIDAARSFVAQVKRFTEMQKQVDEFNQVKDSLAEMLGAQVAKPQQQFSYEEVKARIVSKVNDTGVKGVYLMKRDNTYVVRFDKCGEDIYLGRYHTLDEAIRVRVNAEVEHLSGREITRQH